MPDNVAATVPRSRTSLFLPLRLIAVFTLVAPAVVFSYATWQNHRDISERANERIVRELDVLQEHALKALQTVERAISETNEVLRGLSDEEIRRQESELYLRLKRTQQALPQTGLTGEFVAISVRDTGEGIAPEILARVFEPFFTTKEVGRGTGLGLSQVYGFAQQAGGTATLDSEPGRGTTVTLYLPRSAAEAARRKTANASENAPRGARIRGQVLLVEDNADVAEVTRGLLEDAGYSVLGAFDVRSALAILGRRERIDAVLSDIVMPGGASGLDLARKVREDFGAALPVILATGYSDKAQAAADEGFILLRKPYNQADLRKALAKALASGRKKGVA